MLWSTLDLRIAKRRPRREVQTGVDNHTFRNDNAGAPKGHVVCWYAERPGHPTGSNLCALDGHVQPCCESSLRTIGATSCEVASPFCRRIRGRYPSPATTQVRRRRSLVEEGAARPVISNVELRPVLGNGSLHDSGIQGSLNSVPLHEDAIRTLLRFSKHGFTLFLIIKLS